MNQIIEHFKLYSCCFIFITMRFAQTNPQETGAAVTGGNRVITIINLMLSCSVCCLR